MVLILLSACQKDQSDTIVGAELVPPAAKISSTVDAVDCRMELSKCQGACDEHPVSACFDGRPSEERAACIKLAADCYDACADCYDDCVEGTPSCGSDASTAETTEPEAVVEEAVVVEEEPVEETTDVVEEETTDVVVVLGGTIVEVVTPDNNDELKVARHSAAEDEQLPHTHTVDNTVYQVLISVDPSSVKEGGGSQSVTFTASQVEYVIHNRTRDIEGPNMASTYLEWKVTLTYPDHTDGIEGIEDIDDIPPTPTTPPQTFKIRIPANSLSVSQSIDLTPADDRIAPRFPQLIEIDIEGASGGGSFNPDVSYPRLHFTTSPNRILIKDNEDACATLCRSSPRRGRVNSCESQGENLQSKYPGSRLYKKKEGNDVPTWYGDLNNDGENNCEEDNENIFWEATNQQWYDYCNTLGLYCDTFSQCSSPPDGDCINED